MTACTHHCSAFHALRKAARVMEHDAVGSSTILSTCPSHMGCPQCANGMDKSTICLPAQRKETWGDKKTRIELGCGNQILLSTTLCGAAPLTRKALRTRSTELAHVFGVESNAAFRKKLTARNDALRKVAVVTVRT